MVEKKPIRTAQQNTKADAVLSMFDQISEDVLTSVQAKIDRRVAAKVKHLEEAINQARVIEVRVNDLPGKPIEGIQHREFENLLKTVIANQPVVLVGPAGTGKSHAAENVAKALDIEFFAMSVGAQTSKSDLIGYMDANGNYQQTAFRRAYENGGLFLLDEMDAGNSNVLIQLNAALANGYMSFPDRMVPRHDQFRMIASANTFGSGANRQYVGRNQLDAATIDRFAFLQWNIDPRVEEHLAVGRFGSPWLEVVRHARKFVEEQELRVVVSPRATQRGSRLLAAGLDFNDVLHMALLSQFGAEEKQRMHNECHSLYREKAAAITEAEEVKEEDDSSLTVSASVVIPSVDQWGMWGYATHRNINTKDISEAMFNENDFHNMSESEFMEAANNCEKIVRGIKEAEGVEGINKLATAQIRKMLAYSAEELTNMSNTEMLLTNELMRNYSGSPRFWDEIKDSIPAES